MLAKAKASSHPFAPAQYNSMIRHLALTDIDPVTYSEAEGLGLTHDPGGAESVERASARLSDALSRKFVAQIARQIRDANRVRRR
jgi:hypothetical protein